MRILVANLLLFAWLLAKPVQANLPGVESFRPEPNKVRIYGTLIQCPNPGNIYNLVRAMDEDFPMFMNILGQLRANKLCSQTWVFYDPFQVDALVRETQRQSELEYPSDFVLTELFLPFEQWQFMWQWDEEEIDRVLDQLDIAK